MPVSVPVSMPVSVPVSVPVSMPVSMPVITINQAIPLPAHPHPIVSIGAGGIVHDAHYPAYQKAGFPVAGVFDLSNERAQFMANKFGVPAVYESLEAAVTNAPADAIFDVAVPAYNIMDVLNALPDERAVLIQKPMGESLEQAQAILDVCDRKGLTAAINFQMRYAPYILAARSLIEQGVIGDVHDMEVRVTVYTPWQLWDFLQTVPYPEILYHSIHYLDLVRAFQGDPNGVYAKTTRHPDVPKMDGSRTNIILDYGDMLRANIETNHHHKYGLRHQESYVKWEGTKGAIKATLGVLMNYPNGEPDGFEYCVLDEGDEEGQTTWIDVPMSGTWFPDAFIGSMASLMRYVEGSADVLPTSVADAFRTMAVAEAACRSSDGGATPVVYANPQEISTQTYFQERDDITLSDQNTYTPS